MRGLVAATGALTLALAGCVHPAMTPPAPDEPSAAPEELRGWSRVTGFLDSAVAGGAAPGAVLAVSHRGRRLLYSTGRLGFDAPARPDANTVYDLASLTKVVGLTTAVMFAVDEGRLALDTPVVRYVPAFVGTHKAAVTIRHLLVHASGLPDWRPLFRETATREEALTLADSTPLETAPGTRTRYSDIGAIVLTQVVEAAFGERLDSLLARRLFEPLGMRSTRFLPPADWLPRIAPTENDPWRGHVLRGEVHDENAARLNGVSGHAGLFSTADDLLTFAEWLLGEADTPPPCEEAAQGTPVAPAPGCPPSRPRSFTDFIRRQHVPSGSSRALGWDTPSDGSSAGLRLSPESFGHTGFTGTSLWIDPTRALAVVLLSNRVHPTRENPNWTPVRRQVADLVVQMLEGQADP